MSKLVSVIVPQTSLVDGYSPVWNADTNSFDISTPTGIHGISIPANPSTNQVLVATGETTSVWSQIYDGYIASAAAITVSKLAAGTSAQVLINNATPIPTWVSFSSDVTVSATGATTVNNISGASPVNIAPSILEWLFATTTPTIKQLDQTIPSTNGQLLTIQAQNAVGAVANGGGLALTSGTGTLIAGNVVIQTGGTTRLTVSPTTTTFADSATAITITPVSAGTSSIGFAGSVTATTISYSASTTTANGAAMTLAAQNSSFAGGTGGNVFITAGTSTGTGTVTGGSVNISVQAGTAAANNGSINFRVGSTTFATWFQSSPTGTVNLQYVAGVTAAKILQANNTADNTTGATFTIQAQNSTGLTATGGTLALTSGTGTTAAGPVLIRTGGTTRLTANATGVITIANLTAGAVQSDGSGNLTSSTLPVGSIAASGTDGYVLTTASGVPTWTIQVPRQYEIYFVSGLFTTTSTTFVRAGARLFDMTPYPATIGSLTRTVKFVADIDKTSGATNVEVQLYDNTHTTAITGTDLTSTSNSNAAVTATLTVGSSSGNLRNDVASQYEVQFRMTGGGGADAVSITNARLVITYA